MVAAIRTEYRETSFRSRAEARWAGFFDEIGWRWTYEPLDADGYIPDFLIHGERPLFVEVGPLVVWADFEAKSTKAAKAVGDLLHDVLVVGVDPIVETGVWQALTAGRLGERVVFHDCGLWDCDGQTGKEPIDWPADPENPLGFPPGECYAKDRKGCPKSGEPDHAEFDWDRGNWARCTQCHRLGVYHESMSFVLRPCGHYDGDHYLGRVYESEIETAWAKATNGSQWRR